MDNEKNTMLAVLQLLKKYNLKVSHAIFLTLIEIVITSFQIHLVYSF